MTLSLSPRGKLLIAVQKASANRQLFLGFFPFEQRPRRFRLPMHSHMRNLLLGKFTSVRLSISTSPTSSPSFQDGILCPKLDSETPRADSKTPSPRLDCETPRLDSKTPSLDFVTPRLDSVAPGPDSLAPRLYS